MAQLLPEFPHYGHPTEKVVVDALLGQLPDEALVVVGQRISTSGKECEVDILVALPEAGFVAIEVKSGEITIDEHGDWWQGSGNRRHRIAPVDQVRTAMYALRTYVEHDPRWSLGRQRWTHLLVTPHTRFPADFSVPDCPRDRIIDREQLDHIGEHCRRLARSKGNAKVPYLPDRALDALRTILAGRGLPQRDVVARAAENDDIADALTREQSVLLRAIDVLPRVEIRGGAGSGKTYLALEQARRLSRAGKRVALLCYSHGLAGYLRRVTSGWSSDDRPAYVGEFHALGIEWGAPRGPDERIRSEDATRWWEHDLPTLMADLAEQLPDYGRFDAIVVDEAQDFADSWWRPVIAALRDRENGRLLIVGDSGQSVFQRTGRPPVDLVPLVLDHNLRNTREIAAAFLPLAGERMTLRGASGPAVRHVPVPDRAEAIALGDAEVERLLDAGWPQHDIALLTTGSRHPVQVELQDDGPESYWETFWSGDDIFYGHVLGFKGLERRCVVLVCNHAEGIDRLRERVYVGMSRATDVLVVVGDAGV